MIAFSRIDLEKNFKELVVPRNEYWLASDTLEYVKGDGIKTWDELEKIIYKGEPLIDLGPLTATPEGMYIIDGNKSELYVKTDFTEGTILGEGELAFDVENRLLYIGDGISKISELYPIYNGQNDTHEHSDATLISIDWSKILNKPTSLTLSGDVSGTVNLNDSGELNIHTEVLDDSHLHDSRYYTESEVDSLLADKADVEHNHDDIYYTESEINSLLANKSDITHNHDSDYVKLIDYEDIDILNKIKTVDGEGSGLDADTLDTKHWFDIKDYVDKAVLGIKGVYNITGEIDSETGYYLMDFSSNVSSPFSATYTISTNGQLLIQTITSIDATLDYMYPGVYIVIFAAEKVDGNTDDANLYTELYLRDSQGTETLIATSGISATIDGGSLYTMSFQIPTAIEIPVDSKLVLKLKANKVDTNSPTDGQITITVNNQYPATFTIPTSLEALNKKFLGTEGGIVSIAHGNTADRPTAEVLGRIFIDIEAKAIYFDNGTSWINVGQGL